MFSNTSSYVVLQPWLQGASLALATTQARALDAGKTAASKSGFIGALGNPSKHAVSMACVARRPFDPQCGVLTI